MLPERSVEALAFAPVPGAPERIIALAEDERGGSGRRRAARSSDAVRIPTSRVSNRPTGIPWQPDGGRSIEDLTFTSDGALWLGTNLGLFRMAPDGSMTHIDLPKRGSGAGFA